MELTDEQKRRMEENRLRAIAIRAARSSTGPADLERASSLLSSLSNRTMTPSAPDTSVVVDSFQGDLVSSRVAELPSEINNGASHLEPLKMPLSGSCILRNTLKSTERFDVDIGYHKNLIDIFKTMPSGKYDRRKKRWNFSVSDHDILMEEVRRLYDVKIYPLQRSDVLRCLAEDELVEFDILKLDPILADALYPFQKDGVRYGVKKKGRLLIADDMGLGKTIQGIAIAYYYRDTWPLVVVCPSSLKYTWLEAFTVWLPSLEWKSICIVNSIKDPMDSPDTKVYIMSYNMLVNRKDELCTKNIRIAILDESHFIKNRHTLRAKAAQEVFQKVQHVILLSGTPALARPMDLYTQLHLIDPKRFRSSGSFARRYAYGHVSHSNHWRENGALNERELCDKLRRWVMIRRLKTDVLTELPPKHRQKIFLNSSDVDTDGDVLQHYRKLDFRCAGSSDMFAYYSETAKVKLPAVRKYIADLLESEEKFVCFAHHRPVLDGICRTLIKKDIRYIRIDGSVSSKARAELCRSFQQDKDCRVAVLSITTAHTGITLTAAKLVVFAELYWNPGVLIQAEDRLHRIGQTDNVLVQYLVAEGTADDVFWSIITEKQQVINSIGLGTESFTENHLEVAWAALDGADDSQEDGNDYTNFEDSEVPLDSDDESDIQDDDFYPSSADEQADESSEFYEDMEEIDSTPEEVESVLDNETQSAHCVTSQEYSSYEDFEYIPDSKALAAIIAENLQENEIAESGNIRRSARISARTPQHDSTSESEDDNNRVTRRQSRIRRQLMADSEQNSEDMISELEVSNPVSKRKSRIIRNDDQSSSEDTPSVQLDSEMSELEAVPGTVGKKQNKKTNRVCSDDDGSDKKVEMQPDLTETAENRILQTNSVKKKSKKLESDDDEDNDTDKGLCPDLAGTAEQGITEIGSVKRKCKTLESGEDDNDYVHLTNGKLVINSEKHSEVMKKQKLESDETKKYQDSKSKNAIEDVINHVTTVPNLRKTEVNEPLVVELSSDDDEEYSHQ